MKTSLPSGFSFRAALLVGMACLACCLPAVAQQVPVNLALGKTVTSSSYQNDGLKADLAVDGDPGTRWCAENGSVPQWVQVDLGKAEQIKAIKLEWEKSPGSYAFKAEASADAKTWSPLGEQSYKPADTIAFDVTSARYVRLTVTGTKPGAWASVKEIEVQGTQMVAAGSQKKVARPAAPLTPAAVKAPAGWDVSLFAVPPELNYPTTVCAMPNGDVFVGVDEMGSLGREKGRGRVVRLRDTNHDGKADQFVTVAKMDFPRGVWADGNDVYVLHPPFVTKYTDENGDGVADKSEVLVKGISAEDTLNNRGPDHTTNGFRVGPDGWMYIAMGDFGATKAVGKDGTELQVHGGGVVRVRLDGTGLEKYSFGQRNIYDVAVDPFGNVFTRDNTNDGGGWNVRLSHVIPTGNYGYPRLFIRFGDEIVQPLNDYGGGSPCGALWVDEPNMPAIASGLLTVEWGASKVWRHPLTAKGAGYEIGTKQELFLDLSRPTDIDYDGLGNFYVTSWANGGFNYSGPNVGYLARVSPKDFKAAYTDVTKLADNALAAALESPSMKAREMAQREILRRGAKPVFGLALAGLLTGADRDSRPQASPAVRAAALFTLKQLQGDKANALLADVAAKQADVREVALRALADKVGDKAAPVEPFIAACKDANPRVRLVAAWGLGRLGSPAGVDAVLPLAGDEDPLVRHVAVNALVALKAGPKYVEQVSASNPKLSAGLLQAAQQIHEPAVLDALAAQIARTTDPATKSALYRAVARLHFTEAKWEGNWWGTRPDTSGPYYKTAEWAGTAKARDILETALKTENPDLVRQLVIDMQRHKIPSPAVQAYVSAAAKTDPRFREMLVDQLAGARDAKFTADNVAMLRGVALDEKSEPALRAKAIRALGKDNKDDASLAATTEALAAIISAEKPAKSLVDLFDETARDAKNAQALKYYEKLASEGDTAAKRELGYSVLVSLATGKLAKADVKEKAAKAVDAGWAKPTTSAALLRAVGRMKAADYREQVLALGSDSNADVARAAAFATERLGLKKAGGAPTASADLIEKLGYDKTLALVLKDKGDAAIGKEVFARVGCVGCHTVSADEPLKGPFLGGISTRYSRTELVESIIKPNAKISQGFETQWFKDKQDEIIEGFVTREAGDELELRNAAGVATVLKKSDIVRRGKRETSIMPEALVDKITPAELASLIAYLETLKAK